MSVTGIDSGSKKGGESPSLLEVSLQYKDGSNSKITCSFMGHSQENPMMMTFISINGAGDEIPIAIINCDEIKEILINEV